MLRISLEVARYEFGGMDGENLRQFEKFGEIQAAFAALVFGNVALRFAEALRHLGLGQLGLFARLDEQFAKPVVLMAMQGIGHPRTIITGCGLCQNGLLLDGMALRL